MCVCECVCGMMENQYSITMDSQTGTRDSYVVENLASRQDRGRERERRKLTYYVGNL